MTNIKKTLQITDHENCLNKQIYTKQKGDKNVKVTCDKFSNATVRQRNNFLSLQICLMLFTLNEIFI